MPKARILVIEDEDLVREMIMEVLQEEAYEVEGARDGHEGMQKLREMVPDLVVLDLNLPEVMRGLDVCRQIRKDPALSHAGILVLTGNRGDEFETALFDAGADEYIRKNDFKPQLFVRRIAAVLRRSQQPQNTAVQSGPLTMYPARREALVEGLAVSLTPTEFDILYKLAENPERALTRRELLDRGVDGEDSTVDRTVDVHVLAVRRKLGKYEWLVSTVWGVGYRIGSEPL